MALRPHLFLAAMLFFGTVSQPLAHADTKTWYTSNSVFTWSCTGMPDLDQVRAASGSILGLPNSGLCYCVPTAITDVLMYIANHGFPEVSPGPGNWQAQSNYNAATSALSAMGIVMGTDPLVGTGGAEALFGIHSAIDPSNKFVVQYFVADKWYSPTFHAMSKAAMNGSMVSFAWGSYDVVGTTLGLKVVNRSGGHALTLTRAVRDGASMTIGCRDPAAAANGTAFDQSFFANRKFVVEPILVVDQPTHQLRLMDALDLDPNHPKMLLIDGYVGLRPKLGCSFTSGLVFPELQIMQPYALLGTTTASSFQRPLSSDIHLLDACLGPDLTDLYLLTIDAGPSSSQSLQQLDLLSGERLPIADLPGATRIVFGRKRELYVLAGGLAHCLDPEAPVPLVSTVNLVATCDAIAFDDSHDQVVFLASAAHKLLRYSEKLVGAPQVVDLPPSLPLSATATMAIRPSDGSPFVATSASSAVFGLIGPQPGSVQVETIQILGVPTPTAIDFDDADHLFIAGAGKVYEAANTAGGWNLTNNQDWAGYSIGSAFKITRSRTNFDPSTMTGPAWNQLPADQVLALETGPSTPDCGVDAASQEYGLGKPGTLGTPALRAPGPPWFGESLAIELSNALPNSVAVLFIGINPLALPFDGGTLLVNPTWTIFLPTSATGSAGLDVPLPNDSALCGLTLFEQMLVLDPGASGYQHIALSNGLMQTIGD